MLAESQPIQVNASRSEVIAMAYETNQYTGMLAEIVTVAGNDHELINAYYARPLGAGPFPAMVLIHHMPGWDAWYFEATRTFAAQGYVTLSPNLYFRAGHGTPDDVAARVRAEGGVADDQAVGDIEGSMRWLRSLPYVNGKVGVFGTCSGGRHAYLAACRTKGFDAVVDCWGGGIVMAPSDISPKRPVAPIDYTADLNCPILGIFGEQDRSPTPEHVAQLEAALKQHGKDYEFHMYPDAGHGFFYHNRPAYRQVQAVDGWSKVFDFLGRKLA